MYPYTGIAGIYDYLLRGLNYEEWADYLEEIFERFQVRPRRKILDLACGTGNSTFPWIRRGYRTWGVDISGEMLALAREKARSQGVSPCFYKQDIRHLSLPFQVDVAVLYQDGLNYLLTEEELIKALFSIHTAVRPHGFFIFNLNLVEKLPASSEAQISWLEDEEEGLCLIWESQLYLERKIWRIKIVAFIKKNNGFYERVEEEHFERSYSREELEPLIAKTGWYLKACYRAFTFEKPGDDDRNIFYVLQRG